MAERPYIDTVEAQGWHLLDVTQELAEGRGWLWDEVALRGPATDF